MSIYKNKEKLCYKEKFLMYTTLAVIIFSTLLQGSFYKIPFFRCYFMGYRHQNNPYMRL